MKEKTQEQIYMANIINYFTFVKIYLLQRMSIYKKLKSKKWYTVAENLAIYITAFFVVITAGELLIKYVIWPYLQLIWKNL